MTLKDIFLKVLRMDNFQCKNPNCNAYADNKPHHLRYKSHGGTDDPGNLITLCSVCHTKAHRGGDWRGKRVSARQFILNILEHWMIVAAKGLIVFRWTDAYNYIKSLPDRTVK